MSNKVIVRRVVDALLGVVLVLVMSTALVQEAPHEFLGIALIVLMCVHVALNRRWFKVLTRGRWTALRAVQVVVIVGLALCLVGQAASAVVLSKHAFGFLPVLPGAAVARRAHMLCSYWMFVLAAAHVGLQMRHLFTSAYSETPRRSLRVVAYAVLVGIAVFGVFAFAQLNLASYLFGRLQFAAGEPNVVLACAQWASVGILVAMVFHAVRLALGKRGNSSNQESV